LRRLHLEFLEDRIAPAAHVGGNDFATIQAAVNAATTGAVITVDPGTYNEAVVVNKSVTIEGAQHGVAGQSSSRTGGNPATESIVGNGSFSFDVTASNVTIDGFTLQGGNNPGAGGFGILITNAVSGTHVVNNIIQDNIIGLGLTNSGASQAVIQNNLFKDNNNPGAASGSAIYSDQFVAGGALKNVLIDHNVFVGNHNAGVGLSSTDPTQGASDIIISNNTFDSNGRQIYLYSTTDSTITGNTIVNATTPTDGGSSTAIGLFGNDNNIAITNNLLQNGNTYGIRIGNFNTAPNSNITITDNSISGFGKAALFLDPNGYVGALNASGDFWGAATGPTDPSNPGGTGGVVTDPAQQVQFKPWLSSGANGVGSAQTGFSGDQGSLISSNPVTPPPPPGGGSTGGSGAGANSNLLATLQQQILRDLLLAQSFQGDLSAAQQQLSTAFFLASRQSLGDATALVFDEISLTTGGILALQQSMLGIQDAALLNTLEGLESSINTNPLTGTQAVQQIISLTGVLVVAALQ
jgi:parallel beta-helix repeat protein